MLSVSELVKEDGKQGMEWYGARFANTVLFRPNITCSINNMTRDFKVTLRRLEHQTRKLDQEVDVMGKNFSMLVKKNKSPSHIRAAAKKLYLKRSGRDRSLLDECQVVEILGELANLALKYDTQKKMIGMIQIYKKLDKIAERKGLAKGAAQYEMLRDKSEFIHELFQDASRTTDIENEESDINALTMREIDVLGLALPDIPVFLDRVDTNSFIRDNGGRVMIPNGQFGILPNTNTIPPTNTKSSTMISSQEKIEVNGPGDFKVPQDQDLYIRYMRLYDFQNGGADE
jgi:hypothetical protein